MFGSFIPSPDGSSSRPYPFVTASRRLFLALFAFAGLSITAAQPLPAETVLRIGQFNIRELDRNELDFTNSTQARAAAEIIQRFAPDVLSINEIAYDIAGQNNSTHTGIHHELFLQNYLNISQNGQPPIDYCYTYFVQGNSGLPSGLGFNYGFGNYIGQYNMLLYSKYPILTDQVRRFQTFLWADLPGNIKPVTISNQQRLMDKDFWDVPIDVNGEIVHILMCHATVPAFDPENEERHFDNMRFLKEYVEGIATYAVPDGGMDADDMFVVIGDLNADPEDGDSLPGAIAQLLNSPRVNPHQSEGDGEDTDGIPPNNTTYTTTTTNYRRNSFKSGIGVTVPGGFQLQLDYILPSVNLPLVTPEPGEFAGRVFWSQVGDPNWTKQRQASDHHFVWTDVVVPSRAGDFDDDDDVDGLDHEIFADVLLGVETDPVLILRCDFSGDCTTDGRDVAGMVAAALAP